MSPRPTMSACNQPASTHRGCVTGFGHDPVLNMLSQLLSNEKRAVAPMRKRFHMACYRRSVLSAVALAALSAGAPVVRSSVLVAASARDLAASPMTASQPNTTSERLREGSAAGEMAPGQHNVSEDEVEILYRRLTHAEQQDDRARRSNR
jgi:hypothetical protein